MVMLAIVESIKYTCTMYENIRLCFVHYILLQYILGPRFSVHSERNQLAVMLPMAIGTPTTTQCFKFVSNYF